MSNLIENNYIKQNIRGTKSSASSIWAIAGGKGGVGKSFVSSSLGIFLANMGFKTLLVDLDLGAANLHTCLGEQESRSNLNHFLKDPTAPLSSAISPTNFNNLSILGGGNDSLDVANISVEQKTRLMSALYSHPSDFILLDLSAGTHDTTIDFFLMANEHLIVTTPEPSSMENAYRFMKAAFFRHLKRYESQFLLGPVIAELMNSKNELGIRSPADLLTLIFQRDPVNGARLQQQMQNFIFKIILNQTRTFKDVNLGSSIRSVSQKYFGIQADFLGHVDFDNAVWQSLRKRKHLLVEYPHSRLYSQLMHISRKLAAPHFKRVAV